MPCSPNRLPVRVYYEDTDFSGRVYHASYLRFFERGRTEWLRSLGFSHNKLAQTNGTAFAVRKLSVEYAASAVIDDLLEVVTDVRPSRGAILIFDQVILREQAAVATATVEVVAIRGDRAVRPPREVLEAFAQLKGR